MSDEAAAVEDLGEIADYLNQYNPAAALHVRSAILDSLQRIVQFPASGRSQSVGGVRKIVTRRYRYLAYYTVDVSDDELVVLTIRHPSREAERPDS